MHKPTYKIFEDSLTVPGHGWGRVTLEELQRLGISHRISSSSRLDAAHRLAYLAEDTDFALFLAAKIKRAEAYEIYKSFREGDSFVRELPRFDNARAMLATLELPLLQPLGIEYGHANPGD